MSDSTTDVIVVGAGPGGLLLACELALAGVRCTVLEKRAERSVESRATGLQARSLEMLRLRGLVDDFLARGHVADHFRLSLGSARIDLRCLDTDFQQLNVCPQSVTEELLEARAVALGAQVERAAEVIGLRQDPDGVTVDVRRDGTVVQDRAGWVVGCDGAHSVVRESLGLEFAGKTYPYNVYVADLRMARPPDDGMLVQVNRHGLVVAIDYGTGLWRLGVVDRQSPRPNREPVTRDEIGAALTRIFGRDLEPGDPVWTSRFVFHKRQATSYRQGRVLLAGDAAHVHAPLGAQGLNICLQDAMNLGWKLASVAKGWSSESLLDTFERERRPVAHRVLEATDRAMRVMMSTRPLVRMLRRVVIPTVLGLRPAHRFIAEQISGLATAYVPRDHQDHSGLVGRRLPEVTLRQSDGSVYPLSRLFLKGEFVLIDQTDSRFDEVCGLWKGRLRHVRARVVGDSPFGAYEGVLVRPDGYCAWVGTWADVALLRSALREYCGEPGQRLALGSL
jgi:2-polyprenyl-6-methoxyphenol hydroxylase-like FAD-dependent oxidoreductase